MAGQPAVCVWDRGVQVEGSRRRGGGAEAWRETSHTLKTTTFNWEEEIQAADRVIPCDWSFLTGSSSRPAVAQFIEWLAPRDALVPRARL